MEFVALSCPQCGGALPRQARWRMVSCPFCGAMVTRSDEVVQAASFHQAWLRARSQIEPAAQRLELGGRQFRVVAPLGGGEHGEVFLAERMDVLPERVVLKIARPGTRAGMLTQEFERLCELQGVTIAGSAYFSQRLPQPVCSGVSCGHWHAGREVMVWRAPVGFWGSMADVMRHYPAGLDPRHVVWMWRRVLEVLGYIHQAGWAHGRLDAAHWLVQPRDHGMLLIGWRAAVARASQDRQVTDLRQAAWTARWLLTGGQNAPGIPATLHPALAEVLLRASEDADWCARQGAAGIDQTLRGAVRNAFGAPRFLPFSPIG